MAYGLHASLAARWLLAAHIVLCPAGLGACAQKADRQLSSAGRCTSCGVKGGGPGGGLSQVMQPAAILAVAAAFFVQLCVAPAAASTDPLVVSQ